MVSPEDSSGRQLYLCMTHGQPGRSGRVPFALPPAQTFSSGEKNEIDAVAFIGRLVSNVLFAEESSLNMALGSFDVGKSGTAMGQVEYHFPADWSGFRPQAGLFFTADSGAYLYTGIGYPFSFAEKWSLNPSVSAGYYHEGAGKDLGYDLEFYSQLQLQYLITDNASVGLGYAHISNASIGDSNPGAETVFLSYRMTF